MDAPNPNITRMTRIKYIRQFVIGKKQEEVEEHTGIPHTLMSMIESGRMNRPYPYMIRKLEEFYGISWNILAQEVNVDTNSGTIIENVTP